MRSERRPTTTLHMDQRQTHLQPVVAKQPSGAQVKRRHSDHNQPDGSRSGLVPMQRDQPVRNGALVYHSVAYGRALAVPLHATA